MPKPQERWLPGYRPQFERSAEALPLSRLRALIGVRVRSVWTLWDAADDTRFRDAPVVLDFGEVRVEVCVNRLDLLSITFNTVDMSQEPDWCGDLIATLEWRSEFCTPCRRMVGRPLDAVRVIEYQHETGAASLAAIEFQFADRSLVVVNAGDENALRFDVPENPRLRVAAEVAQP